MSVEQKFSRLSVVCNKDVLYYRHFGYQNINNIKIHYFSLVNYTEVFQFDDSSQYNNYSEQPENVNYKSVIDKVVVKTEKIEKLILHDFFILFIAVYTTFKCYVQTQNVQH